MFEGLQRKYALSDEGKRNMILSIVACLLQNIILMAPAGILFVLVDRLYTDGTLDDTLVAFAVGTIVVLIMVAASEHLVIKYCFRNTYYESGRRRISLAERLRILPLSFFGKKDLADLTNMIMGDCVVIETASSHWVPEFIGSLISTAIIAVCLLIYNPILGIASMWVFPVSICIMLLSARVMWPMQEKKNRIRMDAADGIQECIESLSDIHANNNEAEYLKGLNDKFKNVEKSTIFVELTNALFNGSSKIILKFGIATTALVGGLMAVDGTLSIMVFFMYLMIVSRMYDPMLTSLDNLSAIITLRVNTERFNEIIEHPVQTGTEEITNNGYDIQFDHVAFSYDMDKQVLRDVSFTAKQGEITAIVGPSGGGKTTAVRLASRFWDVGSGRITVGGMDISKIDPETLLSLYSAVFQDVILFNSDIMDNIRIGKAGATDEEVIAAGKLARCDEFVEKLSDGWNTNIGENGFRLSGGERQCISIARAFLKDAPIILMDEATASLDVHNETLIQNSISELIRDKTVVIIAHRMRTVSDADKIVVIENGVVCEMGLPKELMSKDGIFSHMVKIKTVSN